MPLFDEPLRVGFTGTQIGMVATQRKALEDKLVQLKTQGYVWFHHGNCIGSDEQAAMIAKRVGFKLYSHPCDLKKKQSAIWSDVTVKEKKPLTRNGDIVKMTGLLLAAPRSREEELRSGTWATVRYAKQANKEVVFLFP